LDLDQQKRERQYRQSLEGDRARIVLEELDSFLREQREKFLVEIGRAAGPETAFAISCEARAAERFVGRAKAAVAVGEAAAREIMKE
jgi:hypothetical protein